MERNIGRRDKQIRFWVGVILLVIGHGLKIDWFNLLALIPWVTGYFEFCPLYKLLKTARKN